MKSIKEYIAVLSFSRIEMSLLTALLVLLPLISAVPTLYQISGFETYFDYLEQNPNDNDVYLQYQDISAQINSSKTAADAAVFIVWGLVGLIGYAFVMAIIGFVTKTREFSEELTYEHTNKRSVLFHTLQELAVRCLGILLLFVWASLLFSYVVPFLAVSANNLVNGSSWNLGMVGSGLGLLVVVTLYVHLLVVGLRVVLLRRRVFF